MRLLLISNSGRPFLGWCRPILGEFLRGARTLAFVSAATLSAVDAYWQRVSEALAPAPPVGLGLTVVHCDWRGPWREPLARADAIFVGGGNTYALLQRLKQSGLLDAIGERVRGGVPYIGSSAGSNIAGPTILTTNDWNVVGLRDFSALGLVPFNVNPHYLETDPAMAAHSETRDERIAEYHVVNANVVLGIEESTAIRVEHGIAGVVGGGRVKMFGRGAPPQWFSAGDTLPV